MILGIDCGTTGITVVISDETGMVKSKAYNEFTQYYPKAAWVEHDPMEIWEVCKKTIYSALSQTSIKSSDLKAIGITNQRETTVIWDRKTSEPIYNAIVWQCRRTAEICDHIHQNHSTDMIRKKTGLVLDAYFSATKVKWLLDHVKGARRRAERGELCFGTIDSWLIWKLSGGHRHVTDYTNASRTMLLNIHTKSWDRDLLDLFEIPDLLLPELVKSSGVVAECNCELFDQTLPICGVAGDQQSALYGQACWHPGFVKNTYGTGCFLMMFSGQQVVESDHGLLTTLACDSNGNPAYALEGAVFSAGSTIQWLRDELHLIQTAAETEKIAESIDDTNGVYLVPAFTGLGAPYWNMSVRAALIGLTRGSGRNEIVRAALESLAYQTKDLVDLMSEESQVPIRELRVDGGASQNNFLMQFQADLLDCTVNRPKNIESTVMGAVMLAGKAIGYWKTETELEQIRQTDELFEQIMDHKRAEFLYRGWQDAVRQLLK